MDPAEGDHHQDLVSRPTLSLGSDLPLDTLTLRESFGYDCRRRHNLEVLDSNTLLFITGNLLHFLDYEKDVLATRRSVNGAGISCIAVHPKRPIFAVAEMGEKPLIFIYSWPQKQIVSTLRHGTEKEYSCITFRFFKLAPIRKLMAIKHEVYFHVLDSWNLAEQGLDPPEEGK